MSALCHRQLRALLGYGDFLFYFASFKAKKGVRGIPPRNFFLEVAAKYFISRLAQSRDEANLKAADEEVSRAGMVAA